MAIRLSPAAQQIIGTLKKQHGLDERFGLRVGYDRSAEGAARYVLDLEEGPGERDRSWLIGGVPVFCDGKTFLFLGEITVDYDADRAGFVVLEHDA